MDNKHTFDELNSYSKEQLISMVMVEDDLAPFLGSTFLSSRIHSCVAIPPFLLE